MSEYLRRSRSAWYSFLFVLPLLALYHAGLLLNGLVGQGGLMNGADAMLRAALHMAGIGGWLTSAWFVALVAGIWIYRADPAARGGRLQPRTLALMLGESALYAALFGGVVAAIVRTLMPWVNTGLQIGPGLGVGNAINLSLGAGLYEELLFRVIGMGALYWLLRRGFSVQEGWAAVAALVVSSLIFSVCHYLGPLGDRFQLSTFVFRFVAGVVLAGIYRWRGFGIAAGTHALYDLLVITHL